MTALRPCSVDQMEGQHGAKRRKDGRRQESGRIGKPIRDQTAQDQSRGYSHAYGDADAGQAAAAISVRGNPQHRGLRADEQQG
jgi:hypothetical protein